jgi:hypothetical protein
MIPHALRSHPSHSFFARGQRRCSGDSHPTRTRTRRAQFLARLLVKGLGTTAVRDVHPRL